MNEQFVQKQAEVVAAYDRFIHEADPRDQTAYMASKFQVDYRLMGMIDVRDKRIINIGCAFPVDELYFAHKVKEWVGIDLSAESIRVAETITRRELHPELAQRVRYEVQDATAMTFADGEFDIGLSFSTFDHIPSHDKRQAAINELARVTKPGGQVIITTPNRYHLLYYARSRSQQKRNLSHYGYEYCFAPGELKQMIVAAGLRPLHFVSTFTYRTLDLKLSPAWQRPFIAAALRIVNSLSPFGHRMGYLALKT
jgi:SAM-dependent methyltransferase